MPSLKLLIAAHGHLLLVDAHAGSERRMGDQQITLGTRRGQTINPALSELAANIFARTKIPACDDHNRSTLCNCITSVIDKLAATLAAAGNSFSSGTCTR